MAFETLEQMNKQTTAPLTMRTLEPMMQHQPLTFGYNGTSFVIPLGEDVIKTFEALIELVNQKVALRDKLVDSNYKKLAVKFAEEYATKYLHQHDKALDQPLEDHKPTLIFYPITLPNGERIVTHKEVS